MKLSLYPRSLFGQLLLVLLLGITAAHAVGLLLVFGEHERMARRLGREHVAERIGGVIDAFAAVDPANRDLLLRALGQPPARITLTAPWGAASSQPEAQTFGEAIRRHTSWHDVQVVSVREWNPTMERGRDHGPEGLEPRNRLPPPDLPPGPPEGFPPPPDRPDLAAPGHPPGAGQDRGAPGDDGPPQDAAGARALPPPPHFVALRQFRVQARLGDGAVLTIEYGQPLTPVEHPWALAGWLAGVLILAVAIASWTVNRVTRPLQRLVTAAGKLGRNLSLAPVPLEGPIETQRVADAFNRMQSELQRGIAARSHALAGLSHDLRLPLTRMRLRAEAIAESDVRAGVEADLAEMDAMIGLTLEYLRAGPTSEPFAPLDLDALLDALIDDADVAGDTMTREGAAGAPISGQGRALRRLFSNLLDNARRYGQPPIEVHLRDLGKTVEVEVADRGPGLAQEDLERVFEPYVRIEPSRARHTGGTGLGLAIARAIARAHDGDVVLLRRDGGGLRAVVRLSRAGRPS